MIMKRIFLITISLVTIKLSVAQQFAADSSHWHQAIAGGSYHCYVTGDTVIQSIQVKKIKQQTLLQIQQPFSNPPDLYVYTASDTTFFFNPIFNRFTPLYIFNAQEGDSICLPIVPIGICAEYPTNIQDSTFCFVIDSVRWVQYDTSTLKTFYTKSYQKKYTAIQVNWSKQPPFNNNIVGAYAERLGGLYSGILPICWDRCPHIFECDRNQTLFCYSDKQYSIKLTSGDCANGGIYTSTDNEILKQQLSVSPVPANDFIYINTQKSISIVEIYNSQGQQLMSLSNPKSTIPVSQLRSGIYFLKIVFKDKSVKLEKIIIEH